MQVEFDDAREHFSDLADIVASHGVELVLKRAGQQDVALISATRLAHYQALESSLMSSSSTTDRPAPSTAEEVTMPSTTRQEFLAVSATFSVVSSNVSPRQMLQQFHIECELPVTGCFDISIAVGDDQSVETYLAIWRGFEWPQQLGLSQVLLRCFCLARFGMTELPPLECPCADAFTSVVLEVRERTSSVIDAPLLLLAASLDSAEVAVEWSRFGEEEGLQTWKLEPTHSANPLGLLWQVAERLDGHRRDGR